MALTKDSEFMEAAFDLGQWFETHLKTILRGAGIFLVAAILIAAIFGWKQYRVGKATDQIQQGSARFETAAASQFLDTEALADALVHFEKAEETAGSSAPGPLASYYRGVTLYRLGRNDEAIGALEGFVGKVKGDDPLGWVGRNLLAKLQIEAGNAARAVELFEQVVGDDSDYPQEQALLQLGIAQREAGDMETARATWQKVVDEYPQSASANEARGLIGS